MNLGLMFSSCTASYAYTLPDVLMATMCVLSVKTCREAVTADKDPRSLYKSARISAQSRPVVGGVMRLTIHICTLLSVKLRY